MTEGSPAASGPPPASPGSLRYFVLLYSPPAHRATLATLLALGDEISTGMSRNLDHQVAHVRLEWWQREAERFARGEAQHPWLRTLQQAHPASRELDLLPLVDAAALDLAQQTLRGRSDAAVQRELFILAAQALAADSLSPPQQQWLGELGARTHELERALRRKDAHEELTAALEGLQQQAQAIEVALQPRLAPLLVWIALAARRGQRRIRRRAHNGAPGLDALADNMAAWRAARRAIRGRFHLR